MTNNNRTSANYTVSAKVVKPINEVFNYLINDVSRWWPEEFEGEGSKICNEFILRSAECHYSKNSVIELTPNNVVWLVTESLGQSDNNERAGTKMIFE